MPVLDLSRRLQLHASLEPFTSRLINSEDSLTEHDQRSNVFWLEKDTMEDTFSAVLARKPHRGDESRYHRLQQMKAESWDYFMRIFADGSLTVRVVAVSQHLITCLSLLILSRTSTEDLRHCSTSSTYCSLRRAW